MKRLYLVSLISIFVFNAQANNQQNEAVGLHSEPVCASNASEQGNTYNTYLIEDYNEFIKTGNAVGVNFSALEGLVDLRCAFDNANNMVFDKTNYKAKTPSWGKRRLNLENANLSGLDFSKSEAFACANLTAAKLIGTKLDNANLNYAKLDDANLSYALLRDASLFAADLKNANLYHVYLDDANLDLANLANADLHNSCLYNTYLRKANLSNANFQHAKLSSVNLSSSNLHKTDLRDTKLSNVKLPSAQAFAKGTEFYYRDLPLFYGIKVWLWKNYYKWNKWFGLGK